MVILIACIDLQLPCPFVFQCIHYCRVIFRVKLGEGGAAGLELPLINVALVKIPASTPNVG